MMHWKSEKLVLLTLVISSAILMAGCSTTLTHSSGAHTLDKGEFRGAVSGQLDINTNLARTSLDVARQLNDRVQDDPDADLSEEELRTLLDATAAWGLFRPGFTPEAVGRIGIVERLDLGLRYNGTTLKADAKFEIYESEDGTQAFSIDAGVGRQFSPAPSLVENVTLTEWSRTDLDILALYGFEFEPYGRFWLGPRYMHSWISISPKLSEEIRSRIPDEYRDLSPHQFFRNEDMNYYGGTTGFMAGYKYVYLMVEMTIMYTNFKPQIIDRERNLSGVTIAPNFGLVFEFGGNEDKDESPSSSSSE